VGGEIFCTCPDRPWGPPSLLYNGYRDKAHPKNDSIADRAWDDEGIPASVSPEGGSDV